MVLFKCLQAEIASTAVGNGSSQQPTASKAFLVFEKYPLEMGMQAQLSLGVISPSLLPGGEEVGEKNDTENSGKLAHSQVR